MSKDSNIDKIVDILKKAKQPKSDFVKLMDSFNDPFLVLISCILSLRTNDKITYPATLRMLKLGRTPEDFSKLDVNTLAQAIYPVGFYLNKSKHIIKISNLLVLNHKSKVPDTIEELCKFNGVGRKTANLVLSTGYNIPAICVDVHVHRIFNRIGYINTKTPEQTEMALRNKLPQRYWIDINTLLVTHGQNTCKPIKPMCDNCPINSYCKKKNIKGNNDTKNLNSHKSCALSNNKKLFTCGKIHKHTRQFH